MNKLLAQCIESCYSCAKVCTECADACLKQTASRDLRMVIGLSLDCSDVCLTAARLASRCSRSSEEVVLRALELAIAATKACADACDQHGSDYEPCRTCSVECQHCKEACTLAMQDVGGASGIVQTN